MPGRKSADHRHSRHRPTRGVMKVARDGQNAIHETAPPRIEAPELSPVNKQSTAQTESRAAHLAAVEKKTVAFWRKRGRRVVLWIVGVFVIVGAALWCAREPIAAKVETMMLHELNE